MAQPQQLRQQTCNCSLLLIYRPRKDERRSRPGSLAQEGSSTKTEGRSRSDALPVSNVTAPKKKPSTETLVRCNQPQSWNWSDRQELWNGNRLTDPMDVRCTHTSMHNLSAKTNYITLAAVSKGMQAVKLHSIIL